MANIQISSSGIKKSLQKKYTPLKALVEFIWNGFDAQASTVNLIYSKNLSGKIDSISIKDNGYGIPKYDLDNKFKRFFDSEKMTKPSERRITSTLHGKNGVGRLTFFHFATMAIWETIYQDRVSKKNSKYFITIDVDSLDHVNDGEITQTDEPVGTTVQFNNVHGLGSDDEINAYLINEFCWFLELNKEKNYAITLNGITLDYSKNILNADQFELHHEISMLNFKVRYIQWREKDSNENSKYYFLNSENTEIYKERTSLNNKGDSFFHSVYVKSEMFDDFIYKKDKSNKPMVCRYTKASKDFKFLKNEIDNYLVTKRKAFLREFSNNDLMMDLEKINAFPEYNPKVVIEKEKKIELENVISEIYKIQPKLFAGLTIVQKKTFVRFLDLIMKSNESGNLFKIFDEIIELDLDEREDLEDLLDSVKKETILNHKNHTR